VPSIAQLMPSSDAFDAVTLDQDRFDLNLIAANVELVDDRVDLPHDLRRRRDDERVVLRVRPDAHAAFGLRCLAACLTARRRGLHKALDLLFELGRERFRIGVFEIAHLRVAALLERRVEMRDERAHAQPLRQLARNEHAVGAIIRDDLDAIRRVAALRAAAGAGVERVDHAHDFRGARVLEPDELDFIVARTIEALDDAHQTMNVVGAVGNDEGVCARDVGEVALLRDERTQARNELGGAHVSYIDDVRDDLVGVGADPLGQVVRRPLTRVLIGQDLRDVARLDGHEAVHLQDRQERLIEGVRRHRRRRQDRHVRAHARIDDERLAGDGADRFDDLRDVGVAEGRGDGLLLLGGSDIPSERAEEGAREQPDRAMRAARASARAGSVRVMPKRHWASFTRLNVRRTAAALKCDPARRNATEVSFRRGPGRAPCRMSPCSITAGAGERRGPAIRRPSPRPGWKPGTC